MRFNTRFPSRGVSKPGVLVARGFVGLFGFAAFAAEKPTDEYQKAMKDLGGVAQAMSKPEASEDFAAVTKNVESTKAAFAVVEKYWRAKGTDDALKAVAV